MIDSDTDLIARVKPLAALLTNSGRRLATAESCTGGLLAGACTAVPGSSAWFQGAVVAYDNQVKITQLGVPQAILETHGAVSPETVQAMALGVCSLLGVQVGVAVSGIAGPEGGTLEKPVGTVCIAVALEGVVHSDTLYFTGDRADIRRQSVLMALDMLCETLEARLKARSGAGEGVEQ